MDLLNVGMLMEGKISKPFFNNDEEREKARIFYLEVDLSIFQIHRSS